MEKGAIDCAYQSAHLVAQADLQGHRSGLTSGGGRSKVGRARRESYGHRPCIEEGLVSVSATQSVMDRYFKAMGAEQDFSRFFESDVSLAHGGQWTAGARPRTCP
jgi:hypothetical protein